MKLINLMLGKGRGGLEQAALDYHDALALAGHEALTILHSNAQMLSTFKHAKLNIAPLNVRGEWDILAAGHLRKRAMRDGSEAIIAHGNRAVSIALRALKGRIPVIGVAHNYKIKKRFPKCDGVFTITQDLREELVHLHMPRKKLYVIPNLVRMPSTSPTRKGFHTPITIGTFGRFVDKKGIDIFLLSLQALTQRGINFTAIIGGEGPLAPMLKQQTSQLGLDKQVQFVGWVKDKTAFFDSLDVFVLPSHHEPFGIALIEAMAAGLACITTDTEGPCEIITDGKDALMVDKAKPHAMAAALAELAQSPESTLAMGRAAHATATNQYALPVVSTKLDEALTQLLAYLHNPS